MWKGWPIVDRLIIVCGSEGKQCDFLNNQGHPQYSDYGNWADEGAKFFVQKLFYAGFEDGIKNLDFKLLSVKSKTPE